MSLKCSFISHNNKYLQIGPFKFENKYDRAIRVIFHEFLFDKEMVVLNQKLKPLMKYEYSVPLITAKSTSGQVANDKSSMLIFEKLIYDKNRNLQDSGTFNTSHSNPKHWEKPPYNFNDDYIYLNSTISSNDLMETISKRIEMATNLNNTMNSAGTNYRASLYGLGGMTESHSDIQSNGKTNVATILIWLKSVTRGGGTYFSAKDAEQTMKPIAGSLLLWVNSIASGDSNDLQDHGGCPVFNGSKYTLTRWIYYHTQWKTIPCGIFKNSPAYLPFY